VLRVCTAQDASGDTNRTLLVFLVSTSEKGEYYAVFEFHVSEVHETETCKQTVIFWSCRCCGATGCLCSVGDIRARINYLGKATSTYNREP
jgi:hypothetical protein